MSRSESFWLFVICVAREWKIWDVFRAVCCNDEHVEDDLKAAQSDIILARVAEMGVSDEVAFAFLLPCLLRGAAPRGSLYAHHAMLRDLLFPLNPHLAS